MDNHRIQIVTDRLSLYIARLSDLAELEVLEKECDDYFTFDPQNENNHSVPIKRCLIEGDLPPGGIKENYYFYAIRQNQSLIGFLAFYVGHPNDTSAYISVLYIAEQYRNSGFGSELVKALVEYFTSMGIKEIRLHVSLRNTMGLRFWVKAGFDHITQVQCDGNLLPGIFAGIELLYMCQSANDYTDMTARG